MNIGRAVAVVDGYSTGSALATTLSRSGVRCIHVNSSSEVAGYFLRSFRPDDYELDLGYIADHQRLVGKLRELGVTRVVPGTESGVVLADTVGNALGIPGNALELVQARRDKSLMAQAVRDARLAVPLGEAFASACEAAAWYSDNIDGEAVVKPLDSAGTDNVHFCANAGDVYRACELVLASSNLYGTRNQKVLVQSRIKGTEFYVNSVSLNGIHRVAEIWQYTKILGVRGSPLYDFEELVPRRSPATRIVGQFVFRVLDALGIRSSAAHTEVMLTASGPVLIESGARLGGATMPDVVEKLCGVSQTSLFACSIIDPTSFFSDVGNSRWPAAVRNVSLINPQTVQRQSADWSARLADLPTAVGVSALHTPGVALPATTHLMDSPGYLYLASDVPADVERDYLQLRVWERSGLYGQ